MLALPDAPCDRTQGKARARRRQPDPKTRIWTCFGRLSSAWNARGVIRRVATWRKGPIRWPKGWKIRSMQGYGPVPEHAQVRFYDSVDIECFYWMTGPIRNCSHPRRGITRQPRPHDRRNSSHRVRGPPSIRKDPSFSSFACDALTLKPPLRWLCRLEAGQKQSRGNLTTLPTSGSGRESRH